VSQFLAFGDQVVGLDASIREGLRHLGVERTQAGDARADAAGEAMVQDRRFPEVVF
jgi:hypothetical protein